MSFNFLYIDSFCYLYFVNVNVYTIWRIRHLAQAQTNQLYIKKVNHKSIKVPKDNHIAVYTL